MKPRHQAQCAAGNQPVTAPARFPFLLALLWLTLSGCDNASRNAPSEATPPPRASNVPLRIQIVSEVTSPDIIQRQWLSGSEQPIDIQPRNVDDFLAAPACEADIVIFPARLIGELVAKDWIVKLPALDDEELQAVDRGSPRNFPAAWQAQCNYGGVTYAIPLGCSIA